MAEAVSGAQITANGFHGLRHTWACLAVMNGVPLMMVAKNLGHSTRGWSKSITATWLILVEDAIRAGAPKFGFTQIRKLPRSTGRA